MNEKQNQKISKEEEEFLNFSQIDNNNQKQESLQVKSKSRLVALISFVFSFFYRLIISVLVSFLSIAILARVSSISSKDFFKEDGPSHSFSEVDNENDLSSSFFESLKDYPSIDDNSKSILEENLSSSKLLSRFKVDQSKNKIENMLFHGSPGAGKTYAAKEIAEKFSCGYFFASGGSFQRLLVGSGAMKLEKLMNEVKIFAEKNKNSKKPVFLVIDEIDSLGLKKSSFSVDTTLTNTFLTEIDGLKKHNVVVIGTTNDFKQMEEASVRSGRFSCKIEFFLPSSKSDICKICLLSVEQLKKEENIQIEIFEKNEQTTFQNSDYIQISKKFLNLLADRIFNRVTQEQLLTNFDFTNREKVCVSIPAVANIIKSLIIEEDKDKAYQSIKDENERCLLIDEVAFEKNYDFIEQRISRMF